MSDRRPPLVLALDIAAAVGWACGRAGSDPDYGTVRLPKVTSHGAMCCALIDAIADLHQVQHFEEIVFEAPVVHMQGRDPHTARRLVALATAVEIWAERRAIPCHEASASSVRAKVLGTAKFGGRDKAKAAVMAWARGEGFAPPDDNAADALALWAFRTGQHKQRQLGVAA